MGSIAKGSLLSLLLFSGVVRAGDTLYLQSGKLNLRSIKKGETVLRNSRAVETSFFVIQFKSAVTKKERDLLDSTGAKIIRYLPDDAYVVKTTASNVRSLIGHALVQGVLPYQANFKLNSRELAASIFNAGSTKKFIVRVFDGEDLNLVSARLKQIPNIEIISTGISRVYISSPMRNLNSISAVEGVEWVSKYNEKKLQKLIPIKANRNKTEADAVADTNDVSLTALTGYESGTKIMKFESAWSAGLNGDGQIVAVADTGLDTGSLENLNPDFKNLHNFHVAGWLSTTWHDPDGHGTHVSGSVLGLGEKSDRKVLGGAFGSKLVIESLWSNEANTITVPPDFSVLFEAAYQDGARIHTNSWTDPSVVGIYDEAAELTDKYMWEHPDMLILFAAGNDGVDADRDGRVDPGSLTSPATAKNVLSVGASENLVSAGGIQDTLNVAFGDRWPVPPLSNDKLSNSETGMAGFSSRGPTRDGRLKPEIVAPGTNILSVCSHFNGASEMWGRYNKDYCFSGGTSMSTPLVAGAAAVTRQYLIEKRGQKTPSAALVKALLLQTAFDMYPGQFGAVGKENGQELLVPGPNSDQGYGRLDMHQATQSNIELIDEVTGVATGEALSYEVPQGVQKVTLVYTDHPGSPAAAKALVNDLDLEVHVGDRFFMSDSKVNNSEQVVLKINNQNVRIVVKGKNVPMGKDGKQPFALVYQ